MKKIMLVGGTGSLGTKIAKSLVDIGADVTAMVRENSKRERLQSIGVKNFVIGDMMNPALLKNAINQSNYFDAIVVSAAGYTKHSKGDNPDVDTIGYRNLIDAVKEAKIPRFVLVSILECQNAKFVPHFYNKYLIEEYLKEKNQPFIALRPGMFLDQTPDFMLKKIQAGILPVFMRGTYGMIHTNNLAKYVAMAATKVPDSYLNQTVDVGFTSNNDGKELRMAFDKILGKKIKIKPAIPSFALNYIIPIIGKFNPFVKDMAEMIRWVETGQYVSKNEDKQLEVFGEKITLEESVRLYCQDNKLN